MHNVSIQIVYFLCMSKALSPICSLKKSPAKLKKRNTCTSQLCFVFKAVTHILTYHEEYCLTSQYSPSTYLYSFTVKPVLSGRSQNDQNLFLRPIIAEGQKYCRMLQGEYSAIISTFIKLPLRALFCLFLSGRLRQVLLYHFRHITLWCTLDLR